LKQVRIEIAAVSFRKGSGAKKYPLSPVRDERKSLTYFGE